jgi:hypothetical protein
MRKQRNLRKADCMCIIFDVTNRVYYTASVYLCIQYYFLKTKVIEMIRIIDILENPYCINCHLHHCHLQHAGYLYQYYCLNVRNETLQAGEKTDAEKAALKRYELGRLLFPQ